MCSYFFLGLADILSCSTLAWSSAGGGDTLFGDGGGHGLHSPRGGDWYGDVGLVALDRGHLGKFMFWVAVAALFHKSAVILIPLAIFSGTKRKLWVAIWVSVTFVLLYNLILLDSVDSFKSSYHNAEFQSSGAYIRIAMNALPAVLFLMYRRRFKLEKDGRYFGHGWRGARCFLLCCCCIFRVHPRRWIG